MATEIEKLELTIRTGFLQFLEKFDALIAAERDRNELGREHLEFEKARQAKMDDAFEEQKRQAERIFGVPIRGATAAPAVTVPDNVPPRTPADGPLRPRHPRR